MKEDKHLSKPAPPRRQQHFDRPQLECRECETICERVVYPWHCLQSGCCYVYVFPEGESTYFGCLRKIFAAELDLAVFTADPAAKKRRGDPYGPLRVVKVPLPDCPVSVERAYPSDLQSECCCNPTFFCEPVGCAQSEIRITCKGHPRLTPDDHKA